MKARIEDNWRGGAYDLFLDRNFSNAGTCVKQTRQDEPSWSCVLETGLRLKAALRLLVSHVHLSQMRLIR